MLILACATARECASALGRAASSATSWPQRLSVHGKDILACTVGIGPVAAAMSIGMLLERHPQARGVINLGICGSFDTDWLPLGGICVADVEIWPEYGVRGAGGESPEAFGFPMLPDLNLNPANRIALTPAMAVTAMGLTLPDSWVRGPSLTVAGVSGDGVRARDLRHCHQAATENMEGFSLALAARLKGLPFLEIRTVSNQVGSRDKSRWDFKAALNALATILPTLCGNTP